MKEYPLHLEAEQVFLGLILRNNKAFEKVSHVIDERHFSNNFHKLVFSHIKFMISNGRTADPISLKKYLLNDLQEKDASLKLNEFISALSNSIGLADSISEYCRQLVDFYKRRELLSLADDVIKNAQDVKITDDVDNQVDFIERELYRIFHDNEKNEPHKLFDALSSTLVNAENAYKAGKRIVGISTGFTELDEMLGGMHPSDLIILAARPSMGKTALALNIGLHAAKKTTGGVLFFSLEMSKEQLSTRVLSQESSIPSLSIRNGSLKNSDFDCLIGVQSKMSELKFFIDDASALNSSDLILRARRLHRKENLSLIVVDYLQLLLSSSKASSNRVQEIAEITRSLKGLAKELNVPILALSQLSRAVEQREHKKPYLSDLRESGSIEQDADVVMFIYREDYYVERKKPSPSSDIYPDWLQRMNECDGKAEVIIAKQRNGPVGTVELEFDKELTKFKNI